MWCFPQSAINGASQARGQMLEMNARLERIGAHVERIDARL
jgi:hypothetical protein